jgi:hypothetical protein
MSSEFCSATRSLPSPGSAQGCVMVQNSFPLSGGSGNAPFCYYTLYCSTSILNNILSKLHFSDCYGILSIRVNPTA